LGRRHSWFCPDLFVSVVDVSTRWRLMGTARKPQLAPGAGLAAPFVDVAYAAGLQHDAAVPGQVRKGRSSAWIVSCCSRSWRLPFWSLSMPLGLLFVFDQVQQRLPTQTQWQAATIPTYFVIEQNAEPGA
jgi:hypothetical protein